MTAGTLYSVKWKTVDDLIIKILKNLIADFEQNRYHILEGEPCSLV